MKTKRAAREMAGSPSRGRETLSGMRTRASNSRKAQTPRWRLARSALAANCRRPGAENQHFQGGQGQQGKEGGAEVGRGEGGEHGGVGQELQADREALELDDEDQQLTQCRLL